MKTALILAILLLAQASAALDTELLSLHAGDDQFLITPHYWTENGGATPQSQSIGAGMAQPATTQEPSSIFNTQNLSVIFIVVIAFIILLFLIIRRGN